MKIAMTADNHLNGDTDYVERFNALLEILQTVKQEGIQNLIIAGDCFDQENTNTNLLEKALDETQNDDLRIFLLPGNHDPYLKQSRFSQSQITVIEETQIIEIGARPFLFVPYQDKKTMGAEIGSFAAELKGSKWILVGHGDLSSNSSLKTDYEIGTYMPLSSKDIEIFQPRIVLLGHIHMPVEINNVYYPGSPCGLDITETGRRRFLVLDSNTCKVESRVVNTDRLYVNERILLYPSDNEVDFLKAKLDRVFETYTGGELQKIRCRISLYGYSFDRNSASRFVESYLLEVVQVNAVEVRMTDLIAAKSDQVRLRISDKVLKAIADTPLMTYEPVREGIIEEALNIIFGGK